MRDPSPADNPDQEHDTRQHMSQFRFGGPDAETAGTRPRLQLPSAAERERAWRIWDVDGDGELLLHELLRAIKLSFPAFDDPKTLHRAISAADNGDGGISRNEFRLVLEYCVYFNNMCDAFEELDADDDGQLSRDEFVRGVGLLNLTTRGAGPHNMDHTPKTWP